MAKVIELKDERLIVDDCRTCLLNYVNKYGCLVCKLGEQEIIVYNYANEIPDWCPLKDE